MSDIEYELRILNVDIKAVNRLIRSRGGKKGSSYLFRRYVFDVKPSKNGTWLRLRTDGEVTSLTLKSIDGGSVAGTREWEVSVGDFDKTLEILKRAGLKPKSYQENKRVEYELGTSTLSIDEWPLLPPYLEIEAPSEPELRDTLRLLGYALSDCTTDNVQTVYAKNGIDIDKYKELRF